MEGDRKGQKERKARSAVLVETLWWWLLLFKFHCQVEIMGFKKRISRKLGLFQ